MLQPRFIVIGFLPEGAVAPSGVIEGARANDEL